jgi:hypothetical protein
MKIPLGDGSYLEPDEAPRDTQWHKKIVATKPIPNTRAGHWCQLECGHLVQTFGRLDYAGGKVLCTQCRDQEEHAEKL